jgi:hypothetical protein
MIAYKLTSPKVHKILNYRLVLDPNFKKNFTFVARQNKKK